MRFWEICGHGNWDKSISERMGVDVSPQQRIEDMIRVTELCIDLLKENEEHHGEVDTGRCF